VTGYVHIDEKIKSIHTDQSANQDPITA
jgi:hypothetical protein